MRARYFTGACCALVFGASFVVQAVTVVKCRDRDGTEFFADHCPGGATKIEEKRVRAGLRRSDAEQLADVAKKNPVVLFTVPDCDACDLVRQQLGKRGVPYTEKDVGASVENQTALRELTGGGTTVPTVAIGLRTFTGYSRAALDLGLDEAGYPSRERAAETGVAAEP
jgi:glutaredoxin